MSDQGISEEELEKLLMESGMETDDEESLSMDAPVEAPVPSFAQTQESDSEPEGDRTMSQSEIDALLASFAASDDD